MAPDHGPAARLRWSRPDLARFRQRGGVLEGDELSSALLERADAVSVQERAIDMNLRHEPGSDPYDLRDEPTHDLRNDHPGGERGFGEMLAGEIARPTITLEADPFAATRPMASDAVIVAPHPTLTGEATDEGNHEGDVEASAGARIGAQARTEVGVLAEAGIEVEAESDVEIGAGAGAQSESEVGPDVEIGAGAAARAGSEVGPDIEIGAGAAAQSEAEVGPDIEVSDDAGIDAPVAGRPVEAPIIIVDRAGSSPSVPRSQPPAAEPTAAPAIVDPAPHGRSTIGPVVRAWDGIVAIDGRFVKPPSQPSIISVVGTLSAAMAVARATLEANEGFTELLVFGSDQAVDGEVGVDPDHRVASYEEIGQRALAWAVHGRRGVVVIDIDLGDDLKVAVQRIRNLGSEVLHVAYEDAASAAAILGRLEHIGGHVVIDVVDDLIADGAGPGAIDGGDDVSDLVARGVPVVSVGGRRLDPALLFAAANIRADTNAETRANLRNG